MSLPSEFGTTQEYFDEALSFLSTHQYLFKHPNTDILVQGVLDHIEIEHIENLEVFEKGFKILEEMEKSTIWRGYLSSLRCLKPVFECFHPIKELKSEELVGPLSTKKVHEVVYLTKEIKELCEANECDTLVDFGSGLGYLDQQIFQKTGFKVLGLECSDSHYVGAKKRQNKYHIDSVENVKYIKHTITGESNINIDKYLVDKFGEYRNFCISGLHACADLSIDAINIFLKMDKAKLLVLMPCCYHKMLQDAKGFLNFPISNCLKSIYKKLNGTEFMGVPFLRLGTQPAYFKEDNLEDIVFNLLARAALQLYASKHGCKLKRKKRKAVNTKLMNNDFEKYIVNATSGYILSTNYEEISENNFDLIELRLIWRQISPCMFKKAAIYILMQNLLQPIIENVILLDRLEYIREQGLKTCQFKKIFDEKISARCFGLIAYKK